MIRRPPRSTRTYTLFPSRRASDLLVRARKRAADLAHSLKTPLAVLAVQSRRARAAGAEEAADGLDKRSEEHTSELQSLMRSSYAVFCLKKKIQQAKQKSIVQTYTLYRGQ